MIERLRGGLIVSVQAPANSPMNEPAVIAAMAATAEANGAVGVRIEGIARIEAVRARVRLPIVGIVKRMTTPQAPYITPTLDDVDAILGAGAEIVAFDATSRSRPDRSTIEETIARIVAGGGTAMADCALPEEGARAARAGASIVATTLCGYTPETLGTPLPAYALVHALRATGAFVICEGGIGSPEETQQAFAAGADAAVVGTAITNIDVGVSRFAAATPRAAMLHKS